MNKNTNKQAFFEWKIVCHILVSEIRWSIRGEKKYWVHPGGLFYLWACDFYPPLSSFNQYVIIFHAQLDRSWHNTPSPHWQFLSDLQHTQIVLSVEIGLISLRWLHFIELGSQVVLQHPLYNTPTWLITGNEDAHVLIKPISILYVCVVVCNVSLRWAPLFVLFVMYFYRDKLKNVDLAHSTHRNWETLNVRDQWVDLGKNGGTSGKGMPRGKAFVDMVMNYWESIKVGNFPTSWETNSFLIRNVP